MSDWSPFLDRPRRPQRDSWNFINLDDIWESFHLADAEGPVHGKLVEGRGVIVPSDREDELLYRISEKRYVLVYWIFIDPEIVGPPWFPWADRELSAEDASLWFGINEIDPPAPLKRVPLRDPAKDPSSRLNRDWKPQIALSQKSADASQGSEGRRHDSCAMVNPVGEPTEVPAEEEQKVPEAASTIDFGAWHGNYAGLVSPIEPRWWSTWQTRKRRRVKTSPIMFTETPRPAIKQCGTMRAEATDDLAKMGSRLSFRFVSGRMYREISRQ